MANLPNTIFRFMQEEETNAKNPGSEFLLQGLGGNNNYLKKVADDLQAQIDAYTASSPGGSGPFRIVPLASFGGIDIASPSGKQWLLAFMAPYYDFTNPEIQTFHRVIAPSFTSHYFFNRVIDGVAVHATAAFTGGSNETLTFGGWGGTNFQWYGWGLFEP